MYLCTGLALTPPSFYRGKPLLKEKTLLAALFVRIGLFSVYVQCMYKYCLIHPAVIRNGTMVLLYLQ